VAVRLRAEGMRGLVRPAPHLAPTRLQGERFGWRLGLGGSGEGGTGYRHSFGGNSATALHPYVPRYLFGERWWGRQIRLLRRASPRKAGAAAGHHRFECDSLCATIW
jgi:hypothetical protein